MTIGSVQNLEPERKHRFSTSQRSTVATRNGIGASALTEVGAVVASSTRPSRTLLVAGKSDQDVDSGQGRSHCSSASSWCASSSAGDIVQADRHSVQMSIVTEYLDAIA